MLDLLDALRNYKEKWSYKSGDLFIGLYSDGSCGLYTKDDVTAIQVFDTPMEAITWLNSH